MISSSDFYAFATNAVKCDSWGKSSFRFATREGERKRKEKEEWFPPNLVCRFAQLVFPWLHLRKQCACFDKFGRICFKAGWVQGFLGNCLGRLHSRSLNLKLSWAVLWPLPMYQASAGWTGGDQLKESESFITEIVCLVSLYCQCLIRLRGESTRE